MARLGRIVVEALILHYGRDEVLRRLGHPFWFQSLGCVLGMDWHSSGITTSVVGALKRGLSPIAGDIGLTVCGGRGAQSRKTPDELRAVGERTGLDGAALGDTSRLVAKIDSSAIQDGFQVYLHSFFIADDGKWVVVQQGMDSVQRLARRYHWHSPDVSSFMDDPHAGIEGHPRRTPIVNFTDRRAHEARDTTLELVHGGPDRALLAIRDARRACGHVETQERLQSDLPYLRMPDHHDVRPKDVDERRLHATLATAAKVSPETFESLLLTPGLGARTLESLALVAEVIHGRPSRFDDPARFAFAHGGKDGHPFPVPIRVYDETIRVMKGAVERAKLGQKDRLAAIEQLDRQARELESVVSGQPVADHIRRERRLSPYYGGRTVEGPATGDPNHPSPVVDTTPVRRALPPARTGASIARRTSGRPRRKRATSTAQIELPWD